MEAYLFRKNRKPERQQTVEALPADGFVWLDFERSEKEVWADWAERLTGVQIFENHVLDSLNPKHTSYFEGTPEYEQLIFQSLAQDDSPALIDTRSAAFYLSDRLLITVHSADDASISITKHRFVEQNLKSPRHPAALMHLILDTMVNRYLAMRAKLSERLETLEERLLNLDDPCDDWKILLDYRRQIRRLEMICEDQIEAVNAWRDGTSHALNGGLQIRINDLLEHIDRVLDHARMQENDIESAIQLHFSAMAHRTNEVMRTLTVLSAIFLPLTLIAGIFGMNFEYMPALKLPYAYFVLLGAMFLLAVALLLWFKRKGWF